MVAGTRYPPSFSHDDKPQWENDYFPVINLQTHHIHASLIRYVQSTPGAGPRVSSFPLSILSLHPLSVHLLFVYLHTPRLGSNII